MIGIPVDTFIIFPCIRFIHCANKPYFTISPITNNIHKWSVKINNHRWHDFFHHNRPLHCHYYGDGRCANALFTKINMRLVDNIRHAKRLTVRRRSNHRRKISAITKYPVYAQCRQIIDQVSAKIKRELWYIYYQITLICRSWSHLTGNIIKLRRAEILNIIS